MHNHKKFKTFTDPQESHSGNEYWLCTCGAWASLHVLWTSENPPPDFLKKEIFKDGNQHKSQALNPERLTAADARAATEAYKKATAEAQIKIAAQDIIHFTQAGSFMLAANCDHPDFISHFEKRGFKVRKVHGGAPGSVVIEW